jgi:divalent metal cation (Fe/Co/Zn/Cd) transporter
LLLLTHKSPFFHPQDISHLWAVAIASAIGFIGNEAVAIFRIRVGRRIGSAALIADGQHARIDGWTSLAVLVGVLGVWSGYPMADPIVGLIITIARTRHRPIRQSPLLEKPK